MPWILPYRPCQPKPITASRDRQTLPPLHSTSVWHLVRLVAVCMIAESAGLL